MKKTVSLALITAFSFFCVSCKKKEGIVVSAIVTFVSGDVTVSGKPGTKVPAKAGLAITKSDTLTTGDNSSAVVQIADEAVIKIMPKSVINFETLENSQRTMVMDTGTFAGKVRKLNKNDGFLIKLPTTVASVRGTNFLVASSAKEVIVTVTEGKVAVAETEAKLKQTDTVIVDPGKTALSAAGKSGATEISLRDAAKEESNTANTIIDIPFISDAEKKSESELNAVIAPFIKNAPADTKNDKRKQIMQSSKASLAEIKEAFNRIDEITLYNNKVISGIIISRGETFTVVTPAGKIFVNQKEIMRTRVVQ